MKSIQQKESAGIVERTLIPHATFEIATRRVRRAFDDVITSREPICLAVLGESRTGKSRVLEEILFEHPESRNNDGKVIPVLKVGAPSKPSPKGLAEKLLKEIGDPRYSRGTENEKTERLKTMLQEAQVRMVMLNEFQHFVDQTTEAVMHHVADWLKSLVEECSDDGWNMALVVAGLPYSTAVIRQNEQLKGRFRAPIMLPRFDWLDDGLREEFIAILNAFRVSLSAHFDMPKIDDESLAFQFYCATGGLIGYVANTLRVCEANALYSDSRIITLNDLAAAHEEAVWSVGGLQGMRSPFRDINSYRSNDELLMAQIRQIGVKEEPQPRSRVPRKNVRRKKDVNAVLAT